MVDMIYGRQRTLRKFIVLEVVARVPYQAWERAAYGALTRVHPRLRLAGRIFERVVETRAQQDARRAGRAPRLPRSARRPVAGLIVWLTGHHLLADDTSMSTGSA
jgi:hypothetical protein